jgi:hypothetical protein
MKKWWSMYNSDIKLIPLDDYVPAYDRYFKFLGVAEGRYVDTEVTTFQVYGVASRFDYLVYGRV